ncbi:MAG: hypothetical protein J1F39_05115 [Clostridiales bacterium]|nr:hypothetical protein [Clostridiales bacterium]
MATMSALIGCDTPDTDVTIPLPPTTPPDAVPKVHSVAITYNDTAVESTLSVDLSLGSIKLGATVVKDDDAEGTLTFDSSVKTVATIDNTGAVTLAKAGETVITASFGGVKASVVLVVDSSYKAKYTITVVGGTASSTGAAAGDIITLAPSIPAHKEFSDWSFDGSQTPVDWMSGNMFKMPEGDVTVTARFGNLLYTLNLVGAKVTSDGNGSVQKGTVTGYEGDVKSEAFAITEYKYTYGTELTFEAVDTPDGYMFVGWDANQVNNRLEDTDKTVEEFSMPDETTTYWAVFSEAETTGNIFTALPSAAYYPNRAYFNGDLTSSGLPLDTFEGFQGLGIAIPPSLGATPANEYPENINGSKFSTGTGAKAVRVIFYNSGSVDVTVELYASYVGNRVTTGWVTIHPQEVIKMTIIAEWGFNSCYWGFVQRVKHSGGGSQWVYFAVGTASAYPKGDKMFALANGTQTATFDTWSTSGLPQGFFNVVARENSITIPYVTTCRLTNVPEYDEDNPYTTVYLKLQNLSADNSYNLRLAFGKYQDPFEDSEGNLKDGVKYADFTLSTLGQIETFAFRLSREEADSFYVSLITYSYSTEENTKPDSSDLSHIITVLGCITYNNNVGFVGEVIE